MVTVRVWVPRESPKSTTLNGEVHDTGGPPLTSHVCVSMRLLLTHIKTLLVTPHVALGSSGVVKEIESAARRPVASVTVTCTE